MRSFVVVVILAVAAYFLFKPTTFDVKNDIFIYKLPGEVYEFMSDLKRTVEKHSSEGGVCTLIKKRTRKDGVKEQLFLVEKQFPLFWNYELPLNLETRLAFIKPNKELQYGFSILRGYLLKLQGRLTFESREGRVASGCLLTEELTITCPWIAKTFVEKAARDSHKKTLISVRNGLEGLYMPTDEDEEELKPMPEKQPTDKKRQGATSAEKKPKAKKENGAKVKPKASKREQKDEKRSVKESAAKKQSKEGRPEKKSGSKTDLKEKLEKKKASKDADLKPKTAEEGGVGKKTETTREARKEEKAGGSRDAEKVTKKDQQKGGVKKEAKVKKEMRAGGSRDAVKETKKDQQKGGAKQEAKVKKEEKKVKEGLGSGEKVKMKVVQEAAKVGEEKTTHDRASPKASEAERVAKQVKKEKPGESVSGNRKQNVNK